MTTPTRHHPRRGRMAVAAIVAVVLVVVGLVLLATAGPSQPGDPAQAIAGAPSSTTTPNAPDPPPPAGAAVGGPVSTPGSDAGAPSTPAVPVPSSGAGAPPAANGAGPGHPGSSGNAAPGAPGAPGAPAPRQAVLFLLPASPVPRATPPSVMQPATLAALPLVVRRAAPEIQAPLHRVALEVVAPASVLRRGLRRSPALLPQCPPGRSRCRLSGWGRSPPARAARSQTAFWSHRAPGR